MVRARRSAGACSRPLAVGIRTNEHDHRSVLRSGVEGPRGSPRGSRGPPRRRAAAAAIRGRHSLRSRDRHACLRRASRALERGHRAPAVVAGRVAGRHESRQSSRAIDRNIAILQYAGECRRRADASRDRGSGIVARDVRLRRSLRSASSGARSTPTPKPCGLRRPACRPARPRFVRSRWRATIWRQASRKSRIATPRETRGMVAAAEGGLKYWQAGRHVARARTRRISAGEEPAAGRGARGGRPVGAAMRRHLRGERCPGLRAVLRLRRAGDRAAARRRPAGVRGVAPAGARAICHDCGGRAGNGARPIGEELEG